ncbi:hypothetical protein LguiA_010291 [Lonicera macranthoides]
MEGGRVCVTGGTGYVASWLIMRLLQHGYSVNTTIRSHPADNKRDLSYLTNLPGASEKLRIFNADLDKPDSFYTPIEGCVGVFHVAHVIDFEEHEDEETQTKRAINGTLGILRACLNSKTVKRVVYTSSASAVVFNGKGLEMEDENSWTDVDFVRGIKPFGGCYFISKTLTERAVLEFGEKNGLDVVSIIPTFVHGPFMVPRCPGSVRTSLAMIFGDEEEYKKMLNTPFVHVDDVASAHIFLLEYPTARGRYICSAAEITIDKMPEFLSARYPQFQVPSVNDLKEIKGAKYASLSSKKLLDSGFKYKYGLEEMFDGAIQCCKEKGFL